MFQAPASGLQIHNAKLAQSPPLELIIVWDNSHGYEHPLICISYQCPLGRRCGHTTTASFIGLGEATDVNQTHLLLWWLCFSIRRWNITCCCWHTVGSHLSSRLRVYNLIYQPCDSKCCISVSSVDVTNQQWSMAVQQLIMFLFLEISRENEPCLDSSMVKSVSHR